MKNKIVTYSFVILLAVTFIAQLVIKDKEVSNIERRKLEQLNKITVESVFSKKTMDNFEKYTLDQFPFRDTLRTLKAHFEVDVLKKLDTNGYYKKNDDIFKMEYPLNEKEVNGFVNKINYINNTYLKNNNVYYSIIPDKNYYSDDTYLKLDYDKFYKILKDNLVMKEIDIRSLLNLNDYYDTDTHWRQENLGKIMMEISNKMHFKWNDDYQKKEYKPFYGVYYGQSALANKTDNLVYLTNEVIENSKVTHYEPNKSNQVYDLDKLNKMDSYDVFLSGASAFITIETGNQGKELVIFRDSFGSSIAPLFLNSYSKITMIDLRYIDMGTVFKLLDFEEQDILFLYSSLVINHSSTLKVTR